MKNTTLLIALAVALVIGGIAGWFLHGKPDPEVSVTTVERVRTVHDTTKGETKAVVRVVTERDTLTQFDSALAETLLFRYDSLLWEHNELLDIVAEAETETDFYKLRQEYSYRQREFRHELQIKSTDTTRTVQPAEDTIFDTVQKYGFWGLLIALGAVILAK